jgi:hypothetical protein
MTRASHLTLALLATSSLAASCDQVPGWEDLFESDSAWDTAFYDGEVQIAQLDYRCSSGSPDTWWVQAVMDGWAGDVELDIFETGDGNWPGNPNAVWEESHLLTNVDHDPGGAWDVWEATLVDVESPGQQIGGRSTLWGCWWDDGDSLAFKVTVYDDGGREVECAIWGNESEQYFNGYRGDRCLCFDPDGRCDN